MDDFGGEDGGLWVVSGGGEDGVVAVGGGPGGFEGAEEGADQT